MKNWLLRRNCFFQPHKRKTPVCRGRIADNSASIRHRARKVADPKACARPLLATMRRCTNTSTAWNGQQGVDPVRFFSQLLDHRACDKRCILELQGPRFSGMKLKLRLRREWLTTNGQHHLNLLFEKNEKLFLRNVILKLIGHLI